MRRRTVFSETPSNTAASLTLNGRRGPGRLMAKFRVRWFISELGVTGKRGMELSSRHRPPANVSGLGEFSGFISCSSVDFDGSFFVNITSEELLVGTGSDSLVLV